eukprot:4159840-Alexandrium_andersonii.AAC.1
MDHRFRRARGRGASNLNIAPSFLQVANMGIDSMKKVGCVSMSVSGFLAGRAQKQTRGHALASITPTATVRANNDRTSLGKPRKGAEGAGTTEETRERAMRGEKSLRGLRRGGSWERDNKGLGKADREGTPGGGWEGDDGG